MQITSLAPYFGGKRTMAPEIVRQLGSHRCYWEPFAGSMAVLLAKPSCSSETVNDLHGDIVNLARVVRHPKWGAWLYRRLRRVLVSQLDFDEARSHLVLPVKPPAEELIGEADAMRAAHYFIAAWMGRSGMAGTRTSNAGFAKRYTSAGGDMAGRFVAAVQSIPAWRERLRSVCILNEDAFGILAKLEDRAGTAVYLDPPYIVKGASYVHDFAAADHARLADALRRFQRTRIVLSYYAHPLLESLYPGWTVVDCSRSKHMVSAGRRDKENDAVAPEILLINGPAAGEAKAAAKRTSKATLFDVEAVL